MNKETKSRSPGCVAGSLVSVIGTKKQGLDARHLWSRYQEKERLPTVTIRSAIAVNVILG